MIDEKLFSRKRVDVVAFARTFPSSEDARQFVNDVAVTMVDFELSAARIEFLVQALLDGSAEYDWSTYDPQAKDRSRGFFKTLMRLPEFQLS